MKSKKFLAITILAILAIVCVFALVACTPEGEQHECSSKCPTCQKCMDKTCKEDACKDKCPGHQQGGDDELLEYDMSGVTLADKTVTYNGQAQTLTATGLPEGVTATYEYYQGRTKLDSAPVNVGEYTVNASFTGDSQHKAIEVTKSATLTIAKATYEASDVTFDSDTVVYNGNGQTLTATVPAEVGVTYEYYNFDDTDKENKLESAPVNAGKYTVVAKFTVDANHNEIADKEATLTISKATYGADDITFADKTFVYTGRARTITATVPDGLSVQYEHYNFDDAERANRLDSEPANAGKYTVVAKFTVDANHNDVDEMTATLTIEKADPEVAFGAVSRIEGDAIINLEGHALDVPNYEVNDEGIIIVPLGEYLGDYAADRLRTSHIFTLKSSNVPVTVRYYGELNEDGTVKEGSTVEPHIRNVGDTVYALVTPNDPTNHNSVVLTLRGGYRVVKMYTYEDLRMMENDNNRYPLDVKLSTKYVLMNDIDLGGRVWQTIGSLCIRDAGALVGYRLAFVGEFDGQGHTISNFKLTKGSVNYEYFLSDSGSFGGMALGFFGCVTDVKIHDINFDNVTVDFDMAEIAAEGNWESSWSTARVFFGVVAGKVAMNDVFHSGSFFENINVTNVKGRVSVMEGYAGTFFGYDGGHRPQDYPNNLPVRKNLHASNIELTGTEPLGLGGYYGAFRMGGFVGAIDTYIPVIYDNCSLSEIELTLERPVVSASSAQRYSGILGGFVGAHTLVDWGEWPGDTNFAAMADRFINCSLVNFKLVNKSGTTNATTAVICASNPGSGRRPLAPAYENVSARFDSSADKEYGMSWESYNTETGAWDTYTYDFIAAVWSKQTQA